MPDTEPARRPGASFRRTKTGIVTIVEPWEVYGYDLCETFVPRDRPFGFPIVNREADETEVGSFMLKLTFEGLAGEGTRDVDNASEDILEAELDGNMSGDTLKSHPNWQFIAAKYGYSTTTEEFPVNMPTTAGQAAQPNDLHGSDSYLAVGAIFRLSFATKNPPSSIIDKIGEIFSLPPRYDLLGLPAPRGKRNWLKLAPKIDRRGRDKHVSLEFMLSGPRGWNRDVYNFSQLGKAVGGDAPGSGLSTGTLTTGSL